jgi:hypothetical protein
MNEQQALFEVAVFLNKRNTLVCFLLGCQKFGENMERA